MMRPRWPIGIGVVLAGIGGLAMLDAGLDRMPPMPEGGGPAEVYYRPAMVRLPVETQPWFVMGSPPGEPGRGNDEKQQRVRMTVPFAIGETEVTQAQWAAVMAKNPSLHYDPRFSAGSGVDRRRPVEQVNWYEAVMYLNALSDLEGLPRCYELEECTGTLAGGCPLLSFNVGYCLGDFACTSVRFVGRTCRGYRLPTEAEWEYAARAGTTHATYMGPLEFLGRLRAPTLDRIAWYGGNSGDIGTVLSNCPADEHGDRQEGCGTHPVALLQPNSWGLYDMLGNVWEWTEDWYAPDAATDEPQARTNAETIRVTDLDYKGAARVVRGCGWIIRAQDCRVAYRGRSAPAGRNAFLGFRPARSYPSSLEPSDPRPEEADAAP